MELPSGPHLGSGQLEFTFRGSGLAFIEKKTCQGDPWPMIPGSATPFQAPQFVFRAPNQALDGQSNVQ